MTGDIAENFILKDQSGKVFNLYENLIKKILLVFYPGDNTPVCSRQLSNYYANNEKFEKNNIKVVGINIETAGSHRSFCNTLGIELILLCDENKEISRRFGALNFMGVNKRKLVLISENKKILFEKSVFPVRYYKSDQILRLLKGKNLI
jgi:peroxiredoxin